MRSDYPARYQGKNPNTTEEIITANYAAVKEKLNIVTISKDFYQVPNRYGYVQSPRTPDHTRSLKLYPSSNSFCDFANGKQGGDSIRFLSYVKGISNRDALNILCSYYGILTPEQEPERNDELIKQLAEEQKKKDLIRERSAAFHSALLSEIDSLKAWSEKCTAALENPEIEPFSALWSFLINEREKAERKLDLLCAVPGGGLFFRMKPDESQDMPSDAPEWLLDAAEILERAGKFVATAGEKAQIRAAIRREENRNPHVKCETGKGAA